MKGVRVHLRIGAGVRAQDMPATGDDNLVFEPEAIRVDIPVRRIGVADTAVRQPGLQCRPGVRADDPIPLQAVVALKKNRGVVCSRPELTIRSTGWVSSVDQD